METEDGSSAYFEGFGELEHGAKGHSKPALLAAGYVRDFLERETRCGKHCGEANLRGQSGKKNFARQC